MLFESTLKLSTSVIAEGDEDDYENEEVVDVDTSMEHLGEEEDVDHDNVVEDGDDIGSVISSGSTSVKKGRPADT